MLQTRGPSRDGGSAAQFVVAVALARSLCLTNVLATLESYPTALPRFKVASGQVGCVEGLLDIREVGDLPVSTHGRDIRRLGARGGDHATRPAAPRCHQELLDARPLLGIPSPRVTRAGLQMHILPLPPTDGEFWIGRRLSRVWKAQARAVISTLLVAKSTGSDWARPSPPRGRCTSACATSCPPRRRARH